MKNYFTDAQVIELTGEALPHTKDMILTKKCLGEFRKLMNLAVEEAIGEPVFRINPAVKIQSIGELRDGHQVLVNATTTKDNWGFYTHPLYSVKELEN